MAGITDTRSADLGNGLGPKSSIVKIAKTNITSSELQTILEDMALDGHTIAGVGTADGSAFASGVTDVVFVALQGAGLTYAAEGSNAHGVTGAVTTLEAIINQNPA
tara:strand:- start:7699 stop:8016 length:318 start_codon:yes stop_codon:yes gene_type:complete